MDGGDAVVCTRKSEGAIRTVQTATGEGYVHKLTASNPKVDSPKQTAKRVWESPEKYGAWHAQKTGTQQAGIWRYQDAAESDSMVVLRFDKHNSEGNLTKEYRPMHRTDSGWLIGDPEGKLPLYNLPAILSGNSEPVYLCEGEKCCEAGKSIGLLCTTTAHGANSPQKTDFSPLKDRHICILPDNDDPGQNYARTLVSLLTDSAASIRIVELPGLPEAGDLYDYIAALDGKESAEIRDGIQQLYRDAPLWTPLVKGELTMPIDTSQFKPLSSAELAEILGLTIKRDVENKVITFLCELSAYTDSAQFNISFNAPSSTGKSFIPTEIARLFPKESVIEIGYCSPTAFFHDRGAYIQSANQYRVDLSKKILIFLDQPHTLLLQHLRPLLSHDKKEISLKIADKTQKFGLKTKNISLIGFPSVIFCTAGLRIDEQEATRFLLLSPETSQEKIKEAIQARIKRDTDAAKYQAWLDADPARGALKDRIRAIKEADIADVKIPAQDRIETRFLQKNQYLKPRHTRDIARIISLVKAFALLNLWFRERDGSDVIATDQDIAEAFRLWDAISESQEYNLSPYVFDLFNKVIVAAYEEKKAGLTKQDILKKHFQVHRRRLPAWQLQREILPELESAGLLYSDTDLADRRRILYYPTTQSYISPKAEDI
jgi:hypothetical protein